jgi:hypothetical protein
MQELFEYTSRLFVSLEIDSSWTGVLRRFGLAVMVSTGVEFFAMCSGMNCPGSKCFLLIFGRERGPRMR